MVFLREVVQSYLPWLELPRLSLELYYESFRQLWWTAVSRHITLPFLNREYRTKLSMQYSHMLIVQYNTVPTKVVRADTSVRTVEYNTKTREIKDMNYMESM